MLQKQPQITESNLGLFLLRGGSNSKNGCASFDVFADFLQIGIEACFVLAVDDVHQVF